MMSSGIFPGGSGHGTASVGKCLFHTNLNKKLAPSDTPWRANFIPRIAPGLAPPLNLQPRAVEATDLRAANVELPGNLGKAIVLTCGWHESMLLTCPR
jgi:hypothetical protein